MAEPITSILIVGGGTAGWMAAAALKRSVGPHCEVTLVESDDIGIVGVGEATVPSIRDFNALIDLDEAEFMRETKATLKLGIEFVGWGAADSRYIHPFGTYGAGAALGEFHQTWLALRARGLAEDLDAYSLCAQACHAGKAALRDGDPRSPIAPLFTAYHFDAGLYARYLRKVCEGRGVRRVEGEIVEVVQREDGFVDHVRLKDDRTLTADLFIDCTGFRALLIEGAMKAGFEDWSRWLPMNRAMAVPCARVGPTTPYTRSTARDAGWQWRIPLQHRTGNGHVYCADFTTDEDARETLMANLDGEPLAAPRPLRFTTGRRRASWVKNCLALGLAAGFMEPLESTSIHLVQSGLTRFLKVFPDKRFNPLTTAAYNRATEHEYELIRDFLVLHYKATQRDDTPFWRHCRDMVIPDSLAGKIDYFREYGHLLIESGDLFKEENWLQVLIGQGILPRAPAPLARNIDRQSLVTYMTDLRGSYARAAAALPSHEAYLARVMQAAAAASRSQASGAVTRSLDATPR